MIKMLRSICLLSQDLKDPFDILREDNITSSPIIRDNSASAYRFLLVIGILGLVFTSIIEGISLSINKNSTKRSEIKSNLSKKAVIAFIFFGFISLIGMLYDIVLWLT